MAPQGPMGTLTKLFALPNNRLTAAEEAEDVDETSGTSDVVYYTRSVTMTFLTTRRTHWKKDSSAVLQSIHSFPSAGRKARRSRTREILSS